MSRHEIACIFLAAIHLLIAALLLADGEYAHGVCAVAIACVYAWLAVPAREPDEDVE